MNVGKAEVVQCGYYMPLRFPDNIKKEILESIWDHNIEDFNAQVKSKLNWQWGAIEAVVGLEYND